MRNSLLGIASTSQLFAKNVDFTGKALAYDAQS
jgi:hypothetical protein